ncbi:restriction endonuclease subunit S [Pseudomonas cerasi]
MTKYQAYPEYKDSGVQSLGDVPAHWLSIAIKYVAILNPSKNILSSDKMKETCSFIPMEKLKLNSIVLDEVKDVKDVFGGYTFFEDDDVLVAKVTPCFENKNMAVASGLENGIGFGSSEIYVLRCNDKINNGFLYYRLQEDNFMAIAEGAMTGAGGLKRVPSEILSSFLLSLPTLIEQLRITEFLNYETAKIDSLIEKQQQLIELLKEKRQAVISHAVTKGLNPDVPMKDSGIEWLGGVPEHWIIKKSKFLFEFVTSGSRGWSGYYSEEGMLFFRITNLTRDGIAPKLESIQFVSPPAGSEGERSIIKNNDLLISITADLGSVCVANSSISGGYVSQHVALCRPNKLVSSSRWLAYFIISDSAKEQLLGAGYGGTKVQLSLEDIKEFYVACPPEEEQLLIDDYVSIQLSKFEKINNEADKQISLLQKRRTALISAAVTGKIDVRNWVAPAASEAAADTASQEVNA